MKWSNLLRSGHTFTPDEYELEIKYIVVNIMMLLSSFTLAIASSFIYLNGGIFMSYLFGFFLTLIVFLMARKIKKENYGKLVLVSTLLFLGIVYYGYVLLPRYNNISSWVIILILTSALVSTLRLSIFIMISSIIFIIIMNTYLEYNSMEYVLLVCIPMVLSVVLVSIIENKFQYMVRKLEEQNKNLEIKVKLRTRELETDKGKLNYQAHYDDLTALPNRLMLKKELRKRFSNEQRLSLFNIDLDRFKNINDIHGHATGDKVLKIIASRISKIKNAEDFVARMSGDEFIFISNIDRKQEQVDIALKIIKTIEEPIDANGMTIYVTSSIGICHKKSNMHNIEDMMRYSDMAMFEVKKNGKSGYRFFKTHMMLDMEKKINLESEIKKAFTDNTFILHYQPQVDIVKNEIMAIEALIRWDHPIKGSIYPSDFIAIAEDIDLIVMLDYHVLYKGMTQIVTWVNEGYNVPRISFNISGKHLQKEFYLYLGSLLKVTSCSAKYIELEITEGYLISDIDEAIMMLNKLQKLGVHIAIDDFGKGYSSLSYLKSLPINKIKIDKLFIDNICTNEVDATIVKSVINIASSLNIDVVAEGVETKEQRDYLIAEGCRYIQGYYYHKPMDREKLELEVLYKHS